MSIALTPLCIMLLESTFYTVKGSTIQLYPISLFPIPQMKTNKIPIKMCTKNILALPFL